MDGDEGEEYAEHDEEDQRSEADDHGIGRDGHLGQCLPQALHHRDPLGLPRVVERPGDHRSHDQGHRVVGEVPPPAEQVGGGTAQEREEGQERGDDRRVLAEEAGSFHAGPVVGDQDHHEVDESGGSEALDHADYQQPLQRWAESAEAAEDPEDEQAGHEDAPAAVAVGQEPDGGGRHDPGDGACGDQHPGTFDRFSEGFQDLRRGAHQHRVVEQRHRRD